MNIIPSSEVRILTGCRLKPDYKHSIWWVSPTNQYNYFVGLTKYTLSGSQYTRSTENWIKVPYTVAQLLNCNYMIITNTGHENKHYYAFITNVEYVSESASKIWYEIDLIQTWYFECELLPCLVEREHSVTDEIGGNLRPEPVDASDLVIENIEGCEDTYEQVIVVASTMGYNQAQDKWQLNYGGMYGKMFSGLALTTVPATEDGANQIRKLITADNLTSLADIVAIFMAPKFCFDDKSSVVTIDKCFSRFGTFKPNNNKLYTYPFNFLRVSAGENNTTDYRYEYWGLDTTPKATQAKFQLYGVPSCNPGVVLKPIGYRNQRSPESQGLPYNAVEDSMLLTGFPQCAWTSDLFIAFLSQVASAGVSAVGSVLTAQGYGRHVEIGPKGGTHLVRNEGDLYGNAYVEGAASGVWAGLNASWQPERSVKSASNADAFYNAGLLNFQFVKMRITEETARLIDAYFDVYGYATDTVKVPNRTSRPQWNYVKTADCCISASLPSDIVTKIQNIYNNGITFWCWGNNVGDYSLDNKPK